MKYNQHVIDYIVNLMTKCYVQIHNLEGNIQVLKVILKYE